MCSFKSKVMLLRKIKKALFKYSDEQCNKQQDNRIGICARFYFYIYTLLKNLS